MNEERREGSATAAREGEATGGAGGAPRWRFELSIRLDEAGSEIARAPVRDEDLDDARSETWFEGFLRKGQPGLARAQIRTAERPVVNDTTGRVAGFLVESTGPDGRKARRAFGVKSLQHVASREVRRLLAAGAISSGDFYFYDLEARREPAGAPPGSRRTGPAARATGAATDLPAAEAVAGGAASGALFSVASKPAGLCCLSVPLTSILFASREVGRIDPDASPVVFTERAFERAERFSRAGGGRTPPVETGAILAGSLCACPETGEMFVVVHEAIEVVDAAEGTYSLSYSSRTWARIDAEVAALRARPGMRGVRLVGQAHGHNFLPESGAAPCDLCSKEPVCCRSTAFLSDEDVAWSRCVFTGQPWHVAAVFGLNSRTQPVHAVFSQRGGRLNSTGYRVIPGFDPGAHIEA